MTEDLRIARIWDDEELGKLGWMGGGRKLIWISGMKRKCR